MNYCHKKYYDKATFPKKLSEPFRGLGAKYFQVVWKPLIYLT